MAYQDLDSERHEIRLLTISDDESPVITCTLYTVSLLDEPSFKAVSYNWGVKSADRKLLLNGEEMEVMVNLDLLLRQFRHEGHGPLYVDALCINQKDNSEKSKQILLMRDIYSKATEVIAWLGPEDNLSGSAMRLINVFGKFAPKTEMTPGLGGGPISSEECFANDVEAWNAVEYLLGRPYWRRTWILQEIVLAKVVIFRCGPDSASFEDLHSLLSVIGRRNNSPDVEKLDIKVAHLQSIFLILSLRDIDGMNNDGLPLTSILAESQAQLVTNLRDKVYGLLGMASDATILVPTPSYDISESQVYVDLTRSLIVNSKRLAYIRFKSPFGPTHPEMPSWAMDLSSRCFDASISQDILHIPLNWQVGQEANVVFGDTTAGSQTLLLAWGMNMGIVDGVGTVLPIHEAFSGPEFHMIEPDSTANRYGSEAATLDAIIQALTGITPNGSQDRDVNSFRLECRRFSLRALMKPENRSLIASIPEFAEWLDKNKELTFGSRSLATWCALASETLPVWTGSWLKRALMMPRNTYAPGMMADNAAAIVDTRIEDASEMNQTPEDTRYVPQDLATLRANETEEQNTERIEEHFSTLGLNEAEEDSKKVKELLTALDLDGVEEGDPTKVEKLLAALGADEAEDAERKVDDAEREVDDGDQANSAGQISRFQLAGASANNNTTGSAHRQGRIRTTPESRVRIDSSFSRSSIKVFNRLTRSRRNAATWQNTSFSTVSSLHAASSNSSLTEDELIEVELVVKDMLAHLAKYRRVITTSNGLIGSAHPQIRKGDKVCFFNGSEGTYVILREENVPPNQLPRVAGQTNGSNSDGGASTASSHPVKVHRVVGEASLANSNGSGWTPPELKWELLAIM